MGSWSLKSPVVVLLSGLSLATACSSSGGDDASTSLTSLSAQGDTDAGSQDASSEDTTTSAETTETAETAETAETSGDGDGDGDGDMCSAPLDEGEPQPCTEQAQPGSFAPILQWSWPGDLDSGDTYVVTSPLVANMTDDNDDGVVDLCDIPDVVVVAFPPETFTDLNSLLTSTGHIYGLDGETGEEVFRIDDPLTWLASPALADIDGDGEVEIIAPQTVSGNLMAWNADGTKVAGFDDSFVEANDPMTPSLDIGGGVSVHNLDGEGLAEILLYRWIFDAKGALLVELDVGPQVSYRDTLVADLNDDGINEIIIGQRAWSYTGTGVVTDYYDAAIEPGHPQVADLIGDERPEVLVTSSEGISVLDYEGNVLLANQKPIAAPDGALVWQRPATIHDFDGDGEAEFAVSVGDTYLLMELVDNAGVIEISILSQWAVLDSSGTAAGTAFDFLGDGDAEAMYADENVLYVWESGDDQQAPYVAEPRSSRTGVEYPVVADVDNDGSAEIVVISNENLSGGVASPPVQVYSDMNDRWIPARRIWNQHAYSVTHVREDGTIPDVPRHSWETFNSFRTNTQIQFGLGCIP